MDPALTIAEAKALLREEVGDFKPHDCPVCTQRVQVYRRKINSGMAHALIQMWLFAGREWFYLPSITDRWQGRDEAGLRYWGLIEEAVEKREDGGRAGWWRITERGEQYVLNYAAVPTYAHIYDGRVLGFDGERRSITDALADRFNYDELMEGG